MKDVTKEVITREGAQERILKGVETLEHAVAATLGPKGRNVLVEMPFGNVAITKDGVSVAREVVLKDPCENMGATVVKEAASQTADKAGDGTTTATILAASIYRSGLTAMSSGANPILIKRGIDKAVEAVTASIKEQSKPVDGDEGIKSVATVSANWDNDIGELVAKAIKIAGNDGVVTVEDARSFESSIEPVDGMQFSRGFMSQYFITNFEKARAELEDAFILLFDKKIQRVNEILPVLQQVAKTNRPLLVIADSIVEEALAVLIQNKIKGNFISCAVKAPDFGDKRMAVLEDIATITGAKVFSETLGNKLENANLNDLGIAQRVIVDSETTTIVRGSGNKDAIDARVLQIKGMIEKADNDYDKHILEERLGRLTNGVAIIRVGAMSETELKEKKDRIDDALHATRAAIEEGIVPGGGVTLIRATDSLANVKTSNKDEELGVSIVKHALQAPLGWLCSNAGVDPEGVTKDVMAATGPTGFDIANGVMTDMFKAGVVDPAKVTRLALQNAASVAGLVLTTETAIVRNEEKPSKNKNE